MKLRKILAVALAVLVLPGIVPVQAEELYSQTFDMAQVKADAENGVVLTQEVPDGDYTVTVTTGGDSETKANIYINGGERVRAYTLEAGAVQENEQPVVPKDGKIEVQVIGTNPNVTEIEIVQLAQRTEKREKPYIYIAGDSTAQTYDHTKVYPQTGWGQVFGDYFTDDVVVENRSMGGRSLKSYNNDGRLDRILTEMHPGDYVFIQFGINDGAVNKPERYISVPDYKKLLKTKYIGEIEKRGGILVLLTATAAGWWDEENSCFMESRQDYAVPTREVAEETGVAFIDINDVMTEYWNFSAFLWTKEDVLRNYFICEPLESKAYPTGTNDATHLKEKGAREICKLITGEINKGMGELSELSKYVKGSSGYSLKDISGHWCAEKIIAAYESGKVKGVGNDMFMPDKEVTRAEFLQMAMNSCWIDGHAYREGECLEVTNDDWYCYMVQSALDKGLIPEAMLGDAKKELAEKILVEATEEKEALTTEIYSYVGEGLAFEGDKAITREEAAALAMNCLSYLLKTHDGEELEIETRTTETEFIDASEISPQYKNSVEAAYSYKIIDGMGDGTFCPKETLTRAQAVAMCYK